MKNFIAVVDRIEGDYAVLELEGGITIEIPRRFLPAEARDGKVLRFSVELDIKEEMRRKKQVKELQEKLKKRSKRM